jgi:glycerate kinase
VKILLAPDKFKGSLSAKKVCAAIEQGLLKIDPALSIKSIPLADGGEGTCELLTENSGGFTISLEVSDPLFRRIKASYGISEDGSTAFIEMASASGLQLLTREEQNPLKTSTYGTGELIADAVTRGVKKIILAIGGSATNDAGIGMASALGVTFTDKHGKNLSPVGENLIHIHSINFEKSLFQKRKVAVIVLCDVANELYGKEGAAHVFAKQKGSNEKEVHLLDLGLRNFASVVARETTMDVNFPGAGAAGGLGAGCKVFLHATFRSGIKYILETLNVEEEIKLADLVITGEGKMDKQTLSGKVVMGVAQLAGTHQKPVIALVGKNELSDKEIDSIGLKKVIALVDGKTSSTEAITYAANLLSDRASEIQLKSIF